MDYTAYEYDALVDRVTTALKNKEGWGDAYDSSTGQMLIQTLADVTDHLFYMLERRSQEVFLDTARLDSSIRTHASELGYRPRRRVSATGTLLLKLVDSDGELIAAEGEVVIDKGTTVYLGDSEFVTIENYVIPEGQSTVEINVREGQLTTLNVNTSSDEEFLNSNEIVLEEYANIEEYSLEVSASDGAYSDVASDENVAKNLTTLSYASSSDQVYDIKFSNEGMRIVFGDGTFGKIPQDTIAVTYVESSGSNVNVVKTGLSFKFDSDTLYDELNVTPRNTYRYELKNTTAIRGGSEAESTAEIARNAPDFTRTNNRAITSFDHEFWVLRSGIGGIVDAKAYGEQESDSLVFNMNNVIVSYVTSDLLPLTPVQVEQLAAYMENFKILTTHLAFREANYFKVILDMKYKKLSSVPISNSAMYQFLVDLLTEYFQIKRNAVGKNFQKSELIRDIQNMTISVDGVKYTPTDYLDLDIEIEYALTDQDLFYDLYVTIDDSYAPVAGDKWRLIVEGETFEETVQSGDTRLDIINRMQTQIQNSLLALSAVVDGELRIKSRFYDGLFSFDKDSTDDISQFTSTDAITDIPIPKSDDNDGTFLTGSVYIMTEDGTVIFQDDGEGMMVSTDGSADPFEVDYENGRFFSPNLPDGDLCLRFKQSVIGNVYPSDGGVVIAQIPDETDNAAPKSRIQMVGS
ncbi:MAG: hypothetical protein CMF22_11360 [Idiomarinaceae bacterium]|nr:hypothetical protein [Idiomarinaceae bacterium]|tara:strand:- start:110134 stop:112203 length:2070 start_codon:yes stop_codon:yes gene_type:complete